jgi:hypothetical protein
MSYPVREVGARDWPGGRTLVPSAVTTVTPDSETSFTVNRRDEFDTHPTYTVTATSHGISEGTLLMFGVQSGHTPDPDEVAATTVRAYDVDTDTFTIQPTTTVVDIGVLTVVAWPVSGLDIPCRSVWCGAPTGDLDGVSLNNETVFLGDATYSNIPLLETDYHGITLPVDNVNKIYINPPVSDVYVEWRALV